jgi:hypothetical protein
MSIYVYRANNNLCRDNKLHFFMCDECGSINLKNPRNSESDHRDVLRFDCNNCRRHPYFSHIDECEAIKITNENMEEIKQELCEQWSLNPNMQEFNKETKDVILNDHPL